MRTRLTSSDGTVGPALAAAVAAWARLPSLAPALTGTDGLYLVLDAGDGRVLHASAAARALADALAASDGTKLARQIAQAAPRETAPRFARLRLDPRRIAPPVLCLLARGTGRAGEAIVLLIPAVPMTPQRGRPARRDGTAADSAPAVQPQIESSTPEPAGLTCGARFLWRSDAAGTLTALTGAGALAHLIGEGWAGLAGSGRLAGADAVLAALDERRTFRAAPMDLDLGDGPIGIELSGAPLGRGEAAFSGFGGFGLIRSLPVAAEPPPGDADRGPGAELPAPASSAPVPPVTTPPPEPVVPDPRPGPDPGEASLSTDEHAAFREIARALGARYAGDDETAEAERAEPRPASGAVMPFPGHPPEHPDAVVRPPEPPSPPSPPRRRNPGSFPACRCRPSSTGVR